MLLPERITQRGARFFIAGLAAFDGIVLVAPQQAHTAPLETPFSDEVRQAIIHRLQLEVESDQHIWITSSRHGTVHAFLHAQALSGQQAQVDLLCAFRWAYNRETGLYEGFGEFFLLTLLLKQKGITSFRLPLALDEKATGLVEAGWFKQEQDIYSQRAGGKLE